MDQIKCPYCESIVTCSSCGEPLKTAEAVDLAIANGYKYCTNCGKKIASTLAEALANTNNDY